MATIQGIYIALFGRPADPLGLAFFNEATNNGADLTAIGDLAATAEYQSRFEGMNSAQIVTAIYQSLFGRNPELAGLEFFVAQLESGAQNINTIAINILDGAQGADAEVVANKEAAANAWTAAVAADPDALAAYQGQAGIDAGVAFLAGITDDESTIPTEAELDAALSLLIAGQPPVATPGETFTLTDAIGEIVNGTEGDDTIVAVLDAAAPGAAGNGTFNIADQVDGKGGTDTMNISVITGGAVMPAGASVKNVEIVNINQTVAAATGIKDSSFTGVEQLWQIDNDNTASNFQAVTVSAAATAGFRSTGNAATAVDDNFVLNAASKAQTELSVALDGVLSETGNVSSVTFNAAVGGTIETINVSGSVVNSAGNINQLTLNEGAAGTAETLNVSMSSNTTINFGTTFAALETFNAAGSTGNLTVDLTVATLAGIEAVTLGSGKDTVSINMGTEDTTVDLGAGSDVLNLNGTAGVAGNVTMEITLGAGADRFALNTALTNIVESDDWEDGLITVTDFNAAQDVLDLSAAAFTLVVQNLVDDAVDADDFDATLDAVAAVINTNVGNTALFTFDGDTYIMTDGGAGNFGEFGDGDGLVKLTGLSVADLSEGTNLLV